MTKNEASAILSFGEFDRMMRDRFSAYRYTLSFCAYHRPAGPAILPGVDAPRTERTEYEWGAVVYDGREVLVDLEAGTLAELADAVRRQIESEHATTKGTAESAAAELLGTDDLPGRS